jgi:hypothetical protein
MGGMAGTSAGGMAGSSSGSGGAAGTAGSSAGKGGAAGTAGTSAGTAGTGGGTTTLCDDARTPAETTSSGSFETMEGVCYLVVFPGTGGMGINGWGCSNADDRTVTVNGTPVECGADLPAPLMEPEPGSYVFEFSEGDLTYASFYWY